MRKADVYWEATASALINWELQVCKICMGTFPKQLIEPCPEASPCISPALELEPAVCAHCDLAPVSLSTSPDSV